MLTKLKLSETAPMPASRHILNQPTVGVGSPAGDSGKTGRGAVGTAAPVRFSAPITGNPFGGEAA